MNGRTKILLMMTAVVSLAVLSSEVRLHVTRAGVIKETRSRQRRWPTTSPKT